MPIFSPADAHSLKGSALLQHHHGPGAAHPMHGHGHVGAGAGGGGGGGMAGALANGALGVGVRG